MLQRDGFRRDRFWQNGSKSTRMADKRKVHFGRKRCRQTVA
jgi:hypothetical protein